MSNESIHNGGCGGGSGSGQCVQGGGGDCGGEGGEGGGGECGGGENTSQSYTEYKTVTKFNG